MCSHEELLYVREGFEQNARSDGRTTEELRSIILETGQLVQASGSARLKLGLTDVLVAVKVSASFLVIGCLKLIFCLHSYAQI